jgi:hypothetical protein
MVVMWFNQALQFTCNTECSVLLPITPSAGNHRTAPSDPSINVQALTHEIHVLLLLLVQMQMPHPQPAA